MAEMEVSVPVIDVATHTFVVPGRALRSDEDMPQWFHSEALSTVMNFIQALNHSVLNVDNDAPCASSPLIDRLVEILAELEHWISDFPPHERAQRYGNTAFRDWAARLSDRAPDLLSSLLPASHHAAIPELAGYLTESFGNRTRIDYGSGHELTFVAFLCCLSLLGLLEPPQFTAAVTRVFRTYLTTVRALQRAYGLEPAGSHGVWGLDDYQFLPYLWGSAQLVDHASLKPKAVVVKDTVAANAEKYLYFAAIQYIYAVKKGNFFEHSPILHDISGVPTWSKVNAGLHKMYVAEVLKKYPIVQHFPCGSLLRIAPTKRINDYVQAAIMR